MPGEFAISESPISSPLSAFASIASGPSHQVAEIEVKYRFGERYLSESTNRKFMGVPRGIYLGFIPSFTGDVLDLAIDPSYGLSLARVNSQDDPLYSVDVVTDQNITLDFTDHVTFPVSVVLRATGALGQPHTSEIITKTTPVLPQTELLICSVTASQTVVFDEPVNRETPFAYSAAPLTYGFMKDGAVEELLASIALVSEVQDARVDLSGTTQVSLSDRLEADALGSAMADRLGKEVFTIQGDDFLVGVTATSVNVSRSFAKVHRDAVSLTPSEDIPGFASESLVGAATSGNVPVTFPLTAISDSVRNVCAVIDATTEARIIGLDRQVVYGRLALEEIILDGELVFNGTAAVGGIPDGGGTPTAFTTQIVGGDIIEDSDGNFFEVVTTPVVDNALTLSLPTPAVGSTNGIRRRRFTLSFTTRKDDNEDNIFSVTGGTTIRFFFPMWRSMAQSQFDYLLTLSRNFEEPPIPNATTSISGKAAIAPSAPEGKAGAIFAVQQQGGQVGVSHVHTIDFNGVASAGPGVVDVTQRGPTGLPGAPGGAGSPGPPGIQGPTGQGFDVSNTFSESALFQHNLLGSGVQYSFQTSFTGNSFLFLTGGNSEWYSPFVFDSDDHWQIDNITVVSGTTARLDARVPTGGSPLAQVRFFLNAATDT